MSALLTRVKHATIHKGLLLKDIATEIGISLPSLSGGLRRASPGYRHLATIAEMLDVSQDWLFYGTNPPSWYREPAGSMPSRAATRQHTGSDELGLLQMGTMSARQGYFHQDPEQTLLAFKDGLNVLKVRGWSAYPFAWPGQFLVVDISRRPRNRNIVACFFNEGTEEERVAIRRYHRVEDGGYVLSSLNQSMEIQVRREAITMYPVVGVLFPHAFDGVDVEESKEELADSPFGRMG